MFSSSNQYVVTGRSFGIKDSLEVRLGEECEEPRYFDVPFENILEHDVKVSIKTKKGKTIFVGYIDEITDIGVHIEFRSENRIFRLSLGRHNYDVALYPPSEQIRNTHFWAKL